MKRRVRQLNTPNFDAVEAKISAKSAELNALMADFNEKMKLEFRELTKFFFEETGIQAVVWDQYTPGFNDGDPCVFTIGEMYFIKSGFDHENLMSACNYEDDDTYEIVEDTDPLWRTCKKFSTFINQNSGLLDQMFSGDDYYGVTVSLTKDAVYTADYDCGY